MSGKCLSTNETSVLSDDGMLHFKSGKAGVCTKVAENSFSYVLVMQVAIVLFASILITIAIIYLFKQSKPKKKHRKHRDAI